MEIVGLVVVIISSLFFYCFVNGLMRDKMRKENEEKQKEESTFKTPDV